MIDKILSIIGLTGIAAMLVAVVVAMFIFIPALALFTSIILAAFIISLL